MPMHAATGNDFVTLRGDRQVMDVLAKKIASAKHEIIMELCSDEAALFHAELKEAEARGIRLLWSCDTGGSALRPFFGIPPLTEEETEFLAKGRTFSVVIDRRWSMLGSRGDQAETIGLVTEHPVMVRLQLGYFAQELIIYELEQELGREISEKFGSNYQSIWNKYV